jgi:hypothetical protein
VATVDLHEVVSRMATRSPTRSEADLQSDVRLLLLLGDLNLEDDDLEISLEAQAGDQKRIDVEAGFAVDPPSDQAKQDRRTVARVLWLLCWIGVRTASIKGHRLSPGAPRPPRSDLPSQVRRAGLTG